jgi:Kef-type K+ transport system membrane component KefB
LIVAVGLLGPVLALLPSRFAPPIVIGEIAGGVALGVTGTKTIDPAQPTLAFLAAIGFALLMFIVGTRLPVGDRQMYACARRGLLAAAITIAVAIGLAPLVSALTDLHRPAILAVLLATSSAAIVSPIVQLQSESQSNTLLETLAWITLIDVLTIFAVPLVLASGSVSRAVIGSTLVIAGAAVVGVVAVRLEPTAPVARLRTASREHRYALDLRVSLLVLFTLAWVAERFDTSVLIAGFAVGLMVAALGPPRRVAEQLIGLGEGFFVPLFFVVLGARLDLHALFRSRSDLLLLVALVVGATLVHVVAAMAIKLPVDMGLLATAQLGVPAAVATLGLGTGDLRAGQASAVVGAAAITLAIATFGAIRGGFTARE